MTIDPLTPGDTEDGAAVQLAHAIKERRRAAGMSQPQLARAVGYTRQYVSLAERVGKNVPSQELVRALDNALNAGGVLLVLWSRAKTEQYSRRKTRSRPANTEVPTFGDTASRETSNALAPGSPGRNIADLVEEITTSGASDESVNRIDRATTALAESHTQAPAKRILGEVLQLHERAQALLQCRLRLSQKRELFRIESELLAHGCLLFGDLRKDKIAEEWGFAALAYAREAGASEAIAWSALAKTLRWTKRFAESADMARQGFATSPLLPIKVQLANQEANAAALLGDISRAQEALRRAESTAESTSTDSGVSAWSFPTARRAIFAQSIATQTGNPDGALRAANWADAGWAPGEPVTPATWAQIRIGAGLARLAKGELDGVAEEVRPIFELPPGLRVATVTAYVEKLDRRLSQQRLHSSEATYLRQMCREFNSTALSYEPAEE